MSGLRRRQGSVDAVVHCHYATDPIRRPHCTLTAVVRYGELALCSSCQSRRSTLGKGQPAMALPPAPALDVLAWVADTYQTAVAAEHALTTAVTRARQSGQPWSAIGTQLGITRQAAQQRFTTRASGRESTKTPTRAS